MGIRRGLAKSLLVAAPFTLIAFSATSAQKITPGSTCKVLNQRVAYLNKTYICVKSGKKLIWNKGVTIVQATPAPAPTVTITATPAPAPTVTITATPAKTSMPFTVNQMVYDLLHPTIQLRNCLYSALSEADIISVFAKKPDAQVQQKVSECHDSKSAPLSFATNSVRAVAYEQLMSRYNSNAGKTGKLTAEIDPALFQDGKDSIIAGLNDAMQFWGSEILPDARAIIGGRNQWLLDIMCENSNLKNSDAYNQCKSKQVSSLGAGSGWPPVQSKIGDMWGAVFGPYKDVNSNTFQHSFAWGYLSKTEPSISSTSFQSAAVHEFTHLAQWNAYSLQGSSSERAERFQLNLNAGSVNWHLVMFPTLWIEGSASYFGSAIANIKNPDALASTIEVKPGWATGPPPKILDLINYVMNVSCPCTDEVTAERQRKMNLQYWAGGAMTELLVSQFGLDKAITLMTEFGNGYTDSTSTWDAMFKKNYGKDWTAWAQVADMYIADLWAGNPTLLSKYNVSFPHVAQVPLTPEIDSVTAGNSSVIIRMHGFDRSADPIEKIVATAGTGESCEITTIKGSCVIAGLNPDVLVTVKAQAFNAVGGSALSGEGSATPYAPTPEVKSISVTVNPLFRDHYAYEVSHLICLDINLTFADVISGAKTSAEMKIGPFDLSISSGNTSTCLRLEALEGFNLALSNEFTITTRLGLGDTKTLQGAYELVATDLLPTTAPLIAKDLGNGSVSLSWVLNSLLLGKELTFEIAEVRTNAQTGSRAQVLLSNISEAQVTATVTKSSYTEGAVQYVIRVEKTATTFRGTSSLLSNIVP